MSPVFVETEGLTVEQLIAELRRVQFSPTDFTNIVAVRRGNALTLRLSISNEEAQRQIDDQCRSLGEEISALTQRVATLRKEMHSYVADVNRIKDILRRIKRHQIRPRLP
jgi:hypothetical protein